LTVASFNNRNLTQATVRPENWSAANSEAFALILILVWPNLIGGFSDFRVRRSDHDRSAARGNVQCSLFRAAHLQALAIFVHCAPKHSCCTDLASFSPVVRT
jgi:hypothetical protein